MPEESSPAGIIRKSFAGRFGTKVGILGGTFNPPHIAHLIVAEEVRGQLKLDKVMFIPAAIPPHKLTVEILPAEQRLKMVKLATRGNPFFEVSDIELRRKNPSFTIDTVLDLKDRFPESDFHLLVGVDLLIDFKTWKDPDRVLTECTVVAMTRPGFDLAKVDKELLKVVELINVSNLDISSTDIRRRVKSGKSIKYLVPEEVERYICDNSIYR